MDVQVRGVAKAGNICSWNSQFRRLEKKKSIPSHLDKASRGRWLSEFHTHRSIEILPLVRLPLTLGRGGSSFVDSRDGILTHNQLRRTGPKKERLPGLNFRIVEWNAKQAMNFFFYPLQVTHGKTYSRGLVISLRIMLP
jgi:hypothetical protein